MDFGFCFVFGRSKMHVSARISTAKSRFHGEFLGPAATECHQPHQAPRQEQCPSVGLRNSHQVERGNIISTSSYHDLEVAIWVEIFVGQGSDAGCCDVKEAGYICSSCCAKSRSQGQVRRLCEDILVRTIITSPSRERTVSRYHQIPLICTRTCDGTHI